MINKNKLFPKSLRKHGPLTKSHPHIAKMWDYKKNKNKLPTDYAFTSPEKIHWICSQGHSSHTKIYAKANSVHGCSKCYHKKLPSIRLKAALEKHGSLKKHPYLVKEYDELNIFKASEVPCNYRKKIKWICQKCKHKWESSPKVRLQTTNKEQKYRNCPKCSYAITGEKSRKTKLKKSASLEKLYPNILVEWDYCKNKILPNEISSFSAKKVHWICKKNKNHKWIATPSNRINGETGCPKCTIYHTSRAEIRLYSELLKCFKNVKWNNKIYGKEIDIYIEKYKVGFEIDGHFHNNEKKLILDKKKNNFFNKRGIKIIRLRQNKMLKKLSKDDIFINTGKITIEDIKNILLFIEKSNFLNVFEKKFIEKYNKRKTFINEKNYIRICSFLPKPPPENSFLSFYPEASKEWDYEKNGELLPSMFTPGSQIKIWWKCKKNHSFKQSLYHRGARGQGCPKCSREANGLFSKKASIEKYGSLKEKFPELDREFSKKLNSITSSEVSINSNYKAWWFCKKHNHNWKAQVWSRTIRKSGCMLCRNEHLSSKEVRLKKLEKTISLADKFPNISKHWHSKNKRLIPSEVSYGSRRFAWFKCDKNHVFNTRVNNQTANNFEDKLRCAKCYKLYRSEIILETKKNKKTL